MDIAAQPETGGVLASHVQDWLGAAIRHHQAGQLDQAEPLYRRILAGEPGHPVALANLAMLYHQSRALAAAEACYIRALAIQRTPELLSNLGLLRREQGDLAGAERWLREALVLRPDFANALYNLGVTLIDAGQPAEAARLLARRARDPQAPADVHANLARALLTIGERTQALRHGRQALLLKDQLSRTAFRARGDQPLGDAPAPGFDPANPEANIVAFSLWGTRATYTEGAIANAGLVRTLYPGWTCRVYLDDSVEPQVRDALSRGGAQIEVMPRAGTHYGLFWRFFAADDERVRYFLCRDADSRINSQEAAAVAEWLSSGRAFHVMRDAPFHTELILAGLWGGVGGRLRGIREWIDRFWRPTEHRWVDQDFLRMEIWPRICEQSMIHDSCYDLFGARPYPAAGRLPPGLHVGAGFPVPEEPGRRAPHKPASGR
jgi:tetratricopeptide (TPR) repeat protein